MSGLTVSTTMRRVGTDANDTNLLLVRQTDRVAGGLRLICLFLLGFNLVVVAFAVMGLLSEDAGWEMDMIDLVVAGCGVVIAAFGLIVVISTESITPDVATKYWLVSAGFGIVYTVYVALLFIVKFDRIKFYLQTQYHCSVISAMTGVALLIVVVAYFMADFALKTYIFQNLIREMKDVDPRARFAATLGRILDR